MAYLYFHQPFVNTINNAFYVYNSYKLTFIYHHTIIKGYKESIMENLNILQLQYQRITGFS